MNKEKLNLINKLFNNNEIRTVWDKDKQTYYISIVDIVGILSESDNPRKYWSVLKIRLKNEGNQTTTNCSQLKLKSKDGKYRLTDVTDIKGMFRIIQSIPSKNAEPIKQWLAKLGSERIDEIIDPSISIERSISNYRSKGYTDEWISKRIKSIAIRKNLTNTWKNHGITTDNEIAILTNEIYKEWSGMTANEYKQFKGLTKENLRDNMSDIESVLSDLSEVSTKLLTEEYNPLGLDQNKKIAKLGGKSAKVAKQELQKNLNKSILIESKEIINE